MAGQLIELLVAERTLAHDTEVSDQLLELARLIALWSRGYEGGLDVTQEEDRTDDHSTAESSQPAPLAQRTYRAQPESEPAGSEWSRPDTWDEAPSEYSSHIDGASWLEQGGSRQP